MCGLISIIHKEQGKTLLKEHTDAFKQMLYADALRGWDSTGIAAIKHHSNNVDVFKDAVPPATFFHRTPDNTWIYGNQALLGHNRASTRGKTNKENAHPFQEKHITLIHNGTLKFHHFLKNVEVDSHAITHSIVERGYKETLEMLDGAYALIWYDAQTKLLHAARNTERPLYVVETENTFILASEAGLVHWICTRNNIKIKRTQLLTPGLVYVFKTNKKGSRYMDTVKFTILEYKPPVQQQLALPQQTIKPSNVVEIKTPTDEVEGLRVGQTVDVLAFKKQQMSYSCFGLGTQRWLADLPGHPDLVVEFYTDSMQDYTECLVNIKINRLYFSPGMKKNFLIGENPIVPQKKTADATGPMRTSNGIEITDQVLKLCETKYCEECTADFVLDPGMVLSPIVVNGHTYNYKYICADCADYLHITGKKTG